MAGEVVAGQKAVSIKPRIKLVLTKSGKTSYTLYGHTGDHRIKSVNHNTKAWSESATIVLDNHDQGLNAIALKGYEGKLSYGLNNGEGDYYIERSSLHAAGQTFDSAPGRLTCNLTCIGEADALALDSATESYIPTTETCKTLIAAIAGAILAPYTSYTAYTVHWDSEDSLIDSFKPGNSFRIYVGTSRLAAIKRLLDFTNCVMKFDADGHIHIFVPTKSGTTYDYEYSLTSGDHKFFSKAAHDSIILPNWIKVKDYEDPTVSSGEAKYQASIDDYKAKIETVQLYQLASNAEAAAVATAIRDKVVLNAQQAAAYVPMNCDADLWDYVKITDAREGTTKVGNIAWIRRYSSPGRYAMEFGFGGGTDMSRFFSQMDTYTPQYSDPFIVDSAYIKNLQVDQLDFTPITSEDTLDDIADGTTYKRVKSASLNAEGLVLLDALIDGDTYKKVLATQVSAGKILLSSETQFNSGYDPSTKRRVFTATPTTPYDIGDLWQQSGIFKKCTTARATGAYVAGDWTSITTDDVADGDTYKRVLATDISAGHIKLTSAVVVDGSWYDQSGVEIDATHGINIYGTNNAFTTRATKTGTIQCYVGSNGAIYAGAGTVRLSVTGIGIVGQGLTFFDTLDGAVQGNLYQDAGILILTSEVGYGVAIGVGSVLTPSANQITFNAGSIVFGGDIYPTYHETDNCGYSNKAWYMIYGKYIYSDDGAIHSYQEHDDLQILKGLKSKKNKEGRDSLDASSLPEELVKVNDKGERFVSLGGLQGLQLGISQALLAKVERLEAQVKSLKAR